MKANEKIIEEARQLSFSEKMRLLFQRKKKKGQECIWVAERQEKIDATKNFTDNIVVTTKNKRDSQPPHAVDNDTLEFNIDDFDMLFDRMTKGRKIILTGIDIDRRCANLLSSLGSDKYDYFRFIK